MEELIHSTPGVQLGSLQVEYDGPLMDLRSLGSFNLQLGDLIHFIQNAVLLNVVRGQDGPQTLVTEYVQLVDRFLDVLSLRGNTFHPSSLQAHLSELKKDVYALLARIENLSDADNWSLDYLIEKLKYLDRSIDQGILLNNTLTRRSFYDLQRKLLDDDLSQLCPRAIVTSAQVGSLYETIAFLLVQPDVRAIFQNIAATIICVLAANAHRLITHVDNPSGISTQFEARPDESRKIVQMVEQLVDVLSKNGGSGGELRLRYTSTDKKDELTVDIKIPDKRE